MDIERFAECSNLEDLLLCDTKRVRLGEYDFLSSAVRLQTSRQEYLREYDRFTMQLDMSANIRTGFHELVHFFQYHTTPFGMYLSLLCDFQMLQLRTLLTLVKENRKVEYPLLPQICRQLRPVSRYEKIWYHLKYWYLAELVRLYLIGDFANFCYYYEKSIFSEELPSQWFSQLEAELCNVLNLPFTDRILLKEESEARALLHDITLRVASDSDAGNIFENQARMGQYWWEMGYRENPFTNVSYEHKYSGLIAEYAALSTAENFPQFHETFYGICELALFTPILPFQAQTTPQISLRDLNPIVRVRDIMAAAQSVAPIKDMNDHQRFLDEVSEILNYPSLKQILESSVSYGDKQDSFSYDSLLFFTSQRLRQKEFSIFYNLGRWHPMSKYQYADARSFSNFFMPPIVRFSDQTLFFRPGEVTQPLIERYYLFYYLKELLIGFRAKKGNGKRVLIRAPFDRGAEDLELQNAVCKEMLIKLFGDGIPEGAVVVGE